LVDLVPFLASSMGVSWAGSDPGWTLWIRRVKNRPSVPITARMDSDGRSPARRAVEVLRGDGIGGALGDPGIFQSLAELGVGENERVT
jgi:hypothetical protein